MVCVRPSFEYEGVDEPAVEADPNAHPRLSVVGLLGGHQIVEFAVEVRHRQHRQNTRDRLVFGLPAGGGHDATHDIAVRRVAYGVPMSAADEGLVSRTPPDAILLKVLEAVPFELTTDGGAEASRQRFRDLPRRPVHPDVRTEDRTIDGPAGPIPIRVYRPPAHSDATLPIVVFLHGGGWSVGDLDTYDGDASQPRRRR